MLIKLMPTAISEWHSLVVDAEEKSSVVLTPDIEHYVVATLARYTRVADLFRKPLALEMLESLKQTGSFRQVMLRGVGDKCLVHHGLFPELANRRCVSKNYYAQIGQQAYMILADSLLDRESELYHELSLGFDEIVTVLRSI
jgi:hypothetical protein